MTIGAVQGARRGRGERTMGEACLVPVLQGIESETSTPAPDHSPESVSQRRARGAGTDHPAGNLTEGEGASAEAGAVRSIVADRPPGTGNGTGQGQGIGIGIGRGQGLGTGATGGGG